ncbi:uncharacterized protein Gasu_39600 [Galdieria sulphuraria]|uniref:BZIP domain-containing protein n=1 Tax=Galdieria sulphuraria TaxID=130081 RepID=M2XY55_GALSU|nr:uncharacterized protein Gasu_39600 [Galdieria sulphuraria]EME28583.1 hypothetical protein Gasu_39600 [Galdieria sulphuraria]|eukprot:XP_005705103.1 hypothetical protein Gasu_39600 [Galdieria sulphuraria]
MSLESTFMNLDSKSTNLDDQVILESLSSSSLHPHVIKPSKSIETSDIMSTSFQKSSEQPEPSSDCISRESFTNSCHTAPTVEAYQNRESMTKKKENSEGKALSQEDLKRERNRRLAREFRARKKEEIRLYRSTIVNLTQKVRTLAAENQKLQQIVKEIQEKKTTNHEERRAEKHKDEQIKKLQKQVLLYQILLQRLKDNANQDFGQEREKQRCSTVSGNPHSLLESYSSPLPSIKTLTQMDCETTQPVCSPDRELQQRRLSRSFTIPSLVDVPLSNLLSQELVDSGTSPANILMIAIQNPGVQIAPLAVPLITCMV